MKITKRNKQLRRKLATRGKVKVAGRKRTIVIFRTNRYLWAQVVDLVSGRTLLSVSSKEVIKNGSKKITKTEAAQKTGMELAKKAAKLGIVKVAFDRSGYRYHGRVKAFAEGARSSGLKI